MFVTLSFKGPGDGSVDSAADVWFKLKFILKVP